MNYDTLERSNILSKPVNLYYFRFGTTEWFYSSGEDVVNIGSGPAKGSYLPMPISDEGVKDTGKPDDDSVTVTAPRKLPVSQLFIGVPPSDPVHVISRRMNVGSLEAPVMWTGTVKTVRQTGLVECEIVCLPELASFKRKGVRLGWERGCPLALYDSNCTVDPAVWRIVFGVETLSGRSIGAAVLNGFPTGRFIGGYIEWTDTYGSIERRAIENHRAGVFDIMEGTQGITQGMIVNAYPGCPRTQDGCMSFNNLPNYGGFVLMPGRSPFDGDPVF